MQRFLKEEGYSINVATKKPYINAKNAKLRVKYAKETIKSYINKEINLKKVIFSDESSIERGHGARPKYARKKGKKLPGREMISSTNKSTFKNIFNMLFYFKFLLLFFYNFTYAVIYFIIKNILLKQCLLLSAIINCLLNLESCVAQKICYYS